MPSVPTIAQLYRTFSIDDVKGLDPEDPIRGEIREATEAETVLRQKFLSTPVQRTYSADAVSETQQLPSFTERRIYECFLTLTALNVTGRDGKPLFEFVEVNGVKKAKGTWDDFLKRWGQLPTAWGLAIYEQVLMANTDWGALLLDTSDDDESLTEGEEESALAD